jgi:probable phosphoglycerate mutase
MQNIDRVSVYLIRHGETVWNLDLRAQGHGDSPLTEKGRKQVQALGHRMQHLQFDALYASDLGRARQSAAAIAAFSNHPIQLDTRLRERNYGILEGMTVKEVKDRYPEIFSKLKSKDPDYVIPNGESHRQLYQRNIAFFQDPNICRPGSTIAVVAHGGVLDSCFRYVCGIDLIRPRCFATPNAGLSQLEADSSTGALRWVITSWGDVAHLVKEWD